MTATWVPGDPLYAREREHYVCADPRCGMQWSADVLICPACQGPAKDLDGEGIEMDTGADKEVDKNPPR